MAVTLSLSCTQNSQSISANTSNVTVKVIAKWTAGSFNLEKQPGYVKIDGTKYEFSAAFNTGRTTSGSVTLYTKTVNVKHNSDGKKTLSYSAWYSTLVSSGEITASGSKALTTIPRQATLSSAPSFNDEENPTVTYSNPAGNAVSKIYIGIFTSDGLESFAPYREISRSGTSYTFDLDEIINEETGLTVRKKLRQRCNASNSMNFRYYIKTEIGDSTFRSSSLKTFSIINADPVAYPTVTDIGAASTKLTGSDPNVVIKGFNYLTCSYNAAPAKESELISFKIVAGSTTIVEDRVFESTTALPASSILENVDSGTFEFTITDSRNNTNIQTVQKTLVDYIPLTCDFINGKPTADGEMLYTIAGNYFNGCFGVPGTAMDNTLLVQLRYKKDDGAYCDWITVEPTITDNKYSVTNTLTELDYQSTYTFQARAQDALNEANYNHVTTSEIKVKCQPLFDWNEDDFAFNIPVNANNGMTVNNGINTNKLEAEHTLMVRGHSVYIKQDRVKVTISGTPSGSIYSCYYYPMIGMCFLRFYLTGIAMNAKTSYTIGTIGDTSHRSDAAHALAVFALQDYGYVDKAYVTSDGIISIVPEAAKASTDDLYISGFWYAKAG